MRLRQYTKSAGLAALLAGVADASAQTPPAADPQSPAVWVQQGERALARALRLRAGGDRRARNVVLFVGDGMGISTITAARILDGQLRGGSGEESALAFEELPYLALSKTYSTNQQTPDSAPTMSAMVTGVKTGDSMLSVDAGLARREPRAEVLARHARPTILELAEAAGLSTGVVSTARVTHATPAACYAHSPERDWEADADLPAGASVADIAAQLIDRYGAGGIGDGVDVVLGGGRANFLPAGSADPEHPLKTGSRRDGRDLTREWRSKFGGAYVHDRAGFDAIDPARTTHLLGLFEPSHMQYETDRANDTAGEPSLAEMTAKAIDMLARNRKGFFLMVEAGRIDHGHHAGNAHRALHDTIALSQAVRVAMQRLGTQDTLFVVTADHSHVLTMSGYPRRGNPILGLVVEPGATRPALALDGQPYTTLSYANGRGLQQGVRGDDVYAKAPDTGRGGDLQAADTLHPDFHQQALVPLEAETHGGEDVAIFAGGPGAQLFHGVQEQTYVFYVMRHALRL